MRVIDPEVHILSPLTPESLIDIERAGRTCYKSSSLFTAETAASFVRMLIERGHESQLEHLSMTVRFIADRGFLAEITRHRLAAFSVESTRYNNYSKEKFGNECTFIRPFFFNPCAGWDAVIRHEAACAKSVKVPSPIEKLKDGTPVIHLQLCPECKKASIWESAMQSAEEDYMAMLANGAKPEEARSVLPNSLKTEIVVTANAREIRHILSLRTAKAAHPQMRQVMLPLLYWLYERVPNLVMDIVAPVECEGANTYLPKEHWAKVVYFIA